MKYIIDMERLELIMELPDQAPIRAYIVYWIPMDGVRKPILDHDDYCIYWSNQTAHYYAVPRKLVENGGDY